LSELAKLGQFVGSVMVDGEDVQELFATAMRIARDGQDRDRNGKEVYMLRPSVSVREQAA